MKKETASILGIIAILGAILYLFLRPSPPGQCETSNAPSPPSGNAEGLYVKRVVDGDTIVLSDGTKVRLIGVDTPELHYSDKLLRDSRRSGRDSRTIQALGAKAKEFTKRLCLGKRVTLDFDVERNDKYGRTLAYVYLEDGTFVNAEIVRAGYATIMTIPPNVKHADLFLKLERDARQDESGLWREGTP